MVTFQSLVNNKHKKLTLIKSANNVSVKIYTYGVRKNKPFGDGS